MNFGLLFLLFEYVEHVNCFLHKLYSCENELKFVIIYELKLPIFILVNAQLFWIMHRFVQYALMCRLEVPLKKKAGKQR